MNNRRQKEGIDIYLVYIAFFVAYFMVGIFVSLSVSYIPVILINAYNVSRSDLSLVQYSSYACLLIGPFLGVAMDRVKILQSRLRLVLVLTCLGAYGSIFIFVVDPGNLFLFGLFFVANQLSMVFLRSILLFFLLKIAKQNKHYRGNLFTIVISSRVFGSLALSIIFQLLVSNPLSAPSWGPFLVSSTIISGIVLLAPVLLYREIPRLYDVYLARTMVSSNDPPKFNVQYSFSHLSHTLKFPIIKKLERSIATISFALVYFYFFLVLSDNLTAFVFVPFVVQRFGSDFYKLFTLLMVGFNLLVSVGSYLGKLVSKQLLLVSVTSIATACFQFFFAIGYHWELFSVIFLINGFALGFRIQSGNVIFEEVSNISPKSSTVRYTSILTAESVSLFLWTPLGVFLSEFVSVEVLLVVSSLGMGLSAIPLFFLSIMRKEIPQKS